MSITWQFQLWTMSLRNAMTEQNALLLSKVVKSMDKMETKHTCTNMAYIKTLQSWIITEHHRASSRLTPLAAYYKLPMNLCNICFGIYVLTILVQFQNKETANVRFFIKVMTKMKLQQQFHLTPLAHAQCHQGRCHLHWGAAATRGMDVCENGTN